MAKTASRSTAIRLLTATLLLIMGTAVTSREAQANSTQLPSNPNVARQVSLGSHHACYLVNGGQVRCWGLNADGQLGVGTTTNVARGAETSVPGITTAVAVTTSTFQTCALLDDGTIRCWGAQEWGALGNGVTTGDATTPVTVSGITNAVEVELRSNGGCALTSTQEVWCWGYNLHGAVGDGTTTARSTPVQVSGLTDPIRLGSGWAARVSCAITEGPTTSDHDNQLWCWGNDEHGQMTDGFVGGPNYTRPRQIRLNAQGTFLTGVVSVASGGNSTCALLFNGTVWCWGNRLGGRLGSGSPTGATDYSLYPVQVRTNTNTLLANALSLSTADGGVCAASLNGGIRALHCWGVSLNASEVASATSVPHVTTSAVAHIMVGSLPLGPDWCAIMDDNSLVCEGGSAPALVAPNLSGATAPSTLRIVQTVTGLTGCPITTSTPVATNFGGTVSYVSTSGMAPSGVTFSASTGVFGGTPTSASSATVGITATGSTSGSATTQVTFAITNSAMTLAPATLTVNGTPGTAITTTGALTASNRCSTVTYTVTSGTLPAGLTLNANTGAISGTPTEGSTGTVTITATDSTDPSRTATATVTFNVTGASSTAPAPVLPPAVSELVVQPVPTAPPTTTPSPTSTPPTTTMPPTTAPLAPVPAPSGDLPELDSADVLVTEDGELVTVELVVENDEALVLRSPDFELRLRGACTTGCAITEAEGRQTIHLDRQGGASVSGFGFLPGSLVHVWIFSEPRYLGALEVQPDGTYAGTFPLDDIEVGTHTLQANGVSDDNVARSANLGIVVTDASAPTPATGALPATGTGVGSLLIAMMLVLLGGVVALASRRRAATTYD